MVYSLGLVWILELFNQVIQSRDGLFNGLWNLKANDRSMLRSPHNILSDLDLDLEKHHIWFSWNTSVIIVASLCSNITVIPFHSYLIKFLLYYSHKTETTAFSELVNRKSNLKKSSVNKIYVKNIS